MTWKPKWSTTLVGLALTMALTFAVLAPQAMAAPPNDNFASASPLPLINNYSDYSDLGSNVGATKEPGEPNHGGQAGGASVWWTWVAPASGTAKVEACNYISSVVAVYTGASVDALTLIGDGSTSTTGTSCISNPLRSTSVPVVAGSLYRIAVDGVGGSMGDVQPGLHFNPSDAQAPKSRIKKVKVNRARRKATVTFTAKENGNADDVSFECSLDKHKMKACSTPAQVFKDFDAITHTFKHLRPGKHTVSVRGTDGAGNVEKTPATASLKI
jgi:hypothetical protein